MTYKLGVIAEKIGAELIGDSEIDINGINSLSKANANQLSYIANKKYIDSLANTNAGAVILSENMKNDCKTNALLVSNPYLAFAKATHYFKSNNTIPKDKNLNIDPSSNLNNAVLGPGCVIGKNVLIGKNTMLESNCIIEDNVRIGNECHISSSVIIQKDCQLGNNCTISPGTVIGSEGFGNALDENKRWHNIAHLGKVVIGDDVSIGSNTTIDRGTINDTQIHSGVKIDNLVHIAHNVVIGESTAIAAKTGIAGSTVIGKRCQIGGMVGIVGHLNITDDVTVNATSTVNRDINKPGIYTGFFPLMPHNTWKKAGMWLTKLDKITRILNIKLKDTK